MSKTYEDAEADIGRRADVAREAYLFLSHHAPSNVPDATLTQWALLSAANLIANAIGRAAESISDAIADLGAAAAHNSYSHDTVVANAGQNAAEAIGLLNSAVVDLRRAVEGEDE